jgi:MFS family permease
VLGDKSRGFKLGFLSAANLIGYGTGPLIAGSILTTFDINAVFIFSLSGLLPFLLLSAFLPDVPGTVVQLSEYRADLSNKSVLVLIMLVFAFSLHAGAEQSSLSLYMNKGIGLSKDIIGLVYFLNACLMAVLLVINGIIGDRFHARGRGLASLLYVGLFISGLTNIMIPFTSDFGTILSTRLAHAVGDSLSMVTRGLVISSLFITSRMGGNLGAVTATITLATLTGSVISGALPGYSAGFVICGAVAIISIPIAIMSRPDF